MRKASEYERLVWIHKQIKAGNNFKNEYFEKFEVSERTFYRDIEKLSIYFHAPISALNGTYVYDEENFELPHLLISKDELAALYSALGILAKYKNTPIYTTLKKLIDKVEEDSKGNAVSDYQVGYLARKEIGIDWELFDKLVQAIVEQNSVEMDYHSFNSNTRSERKVDPYTVYTYDEELYLAAYCHINNEVRDFNLNRIHGVVVTEDRFEKDFNRDEYFATKNWGIVKGKEVETIQLKILKNEVARVLEDFPKRFKRVGEDGEWEIYEIETTVTDEFLNWIISMREAIVVEGPGSLRAEIRGILSVMLNNYLS